MILSKKGYKVDNRLKELKRYSSEDISSNVKSLIESKKITDSTKSMYIYSKEILLDRLTHLQEVFPDFSLHAVAIKSNSHPSVLKEIVRNGCGLEAASIEEVKLAIDAECSKENIVFDSPVKTIEEIAWCDEHMPGMILNANCFQELDRLNSVKNLRVGIRINPLMDLDNPGMYDVSGINSKFGIPISAREQIIERALSMNQCVGLHIHAGSEIGSLQNHIDAIGSIVDIAEEIRSRGKKLEFIDIGGGRPAKMEPGSQEGLEDFYSGIIEKFPAILDYQVITEYGRFVHAHAAFVISKVEYILDHCSPEIALIHVGADLFPREIYSSHPPYHEISVVDRQGNQKSQDPKIYAIGGPLCFSGDFLTKNRTLPRIQPGDYICISDTGANTLSMWSRHCSREEVEVVLL